ncbi:hypothetical protein BaRGS_00024600 [Batillaria attramentaria]|uniref:Uncharacterized protein n=1 Tax=Batillaria attramentaria TaxID=370345 RepID=A0ABD0KAH4_9CAEN
MELVLPKYHQHITDGTLLLRLAADGANITKHGDRIQCVIKILADRAHLTHVTSSPDDELTLFFFMGVATNEDEEICALSETTFNRILDFSNKWKRLVGAQGDVARELVASSELCSSLQEAADAGVGFHKQCYSRFTDSTRLRRVEGRESRDGSLLHTETETEAPPAKRLRSSDTFVAGTTSNAILPAVCIFCKRERKDIQNKRSKKWTREKLSKMELNVTDAELSSALVGKGIRRHDYGG